MEIEEKLPVVLVSNKLSVAVIIATFRELIPADYLTVFKELSPESHI